MLPRGLRPHGWKAAGWVESGSGRGFFRRWPQVNVRKSDRMDHKRLQVTKEDIRSLHDLLTALHTYACSSMALSQSSNNSTDYCKLHLLKLLHAAEMALMMASRFTWLVSLCCCDRKHLELDQAGCTFNLDETCCLPDGNQRKMLAVRGSRSVKTFGNTNRQSVTILPCVCANGTSFPPYILVKCTKEGKIPCWWQG
jgi:hypothetical protein